MKLNELKQEISYKWRIQTVNNRKPKATCVAYIDARDAMKLLDDVVGPENWQDKYRREGKRLICSVGIRTGDEWVWKEDTGTEGNFEEEKSEFSDSFKRACVKWGIGRFLYGLEIKYINTNKAGKGAYPIDKNGKRIWDLTEHLQKRGSKYPQNKRKQKKASNSNSGTKKRSNRPAKPTDWDLHCNKHNKKMELKFSEKKNKWYNYHYDNKKGICFGGGYKGEAK